MKLFIKKYNDNVNSILKNEYNEFFIRFDDIL